MKIPNRYKLTGLDAHYVVTTEAQHSERIKWFSEMGLNRQWEAREGVRRARIASDEFAVNMFCFCPTGDGLVATYYVHEFSCPRMASLFKLRFG